MVRWSTDVSAADWIVGRLHTCVQDVGSFVPDGFEAYARILHPPSRIEDGVRVYVRWADIASREGVRLEATTRFESLKSGAAAYEDPLAGTLERNELNALVEILEATTSTPQTCWFGVWEGYGWIKGPPAITGLAHESGGDRSPGLEGVGPLPGGPRVQIPDRSLVLYQGPISAAAALLDPPASQSPNLWWPQDHAWCIASEIDFHSTYLGGTQDLVDRLPHDERLEVLPVRVGDPVTD